MDGRNSPAPTSAMGPGIAPRVYLRHCRHDAAATLDAPRDDHRLRRRRPGRRGRDPARRGGRGAWPVEAPVVNAAWPRLGRALPATLVGVLEGQTYVISGYLAVLAAFLILAGAPSDHHRPPRGYGTGV